MSFSPRGQFLKFCWKFAVVTAALAPVQMAHAGFEWIPAQSPVVTPQQKMDNKPSVQPPAVPVAPVNTMPQHTDAGADDMMLPLPGESNMRVKTMKVPGHAPKMPAVVTSNNVPQSVIKQRVVMPSDAPDSAMIKAQDQGEVLTINPFPDHAASGPEPMVMEAMAEKKLMPPPSSSQSSVGQAVPFDSQTLSSENVVGFGSEMPLAMALQQVVPPHYSFSFAQSVNPGHRVSWNGGKPWVEVVRDMIEPLALDVEIHEKVVHVRPSSQAGAAAQFLPEPVVLNDSQRMIKDPGELAASQPLAALETIQEAAVVPQDIAMEKKVSAASQVVSSGQKFWQAQKGDSLKKTLYDWSKDSGFELVWEADYDYRLQTNVMAAGQFEEALQIVFANALDQKNAPSVVFVDSPQEPGRTKLVVKDPAPLG